MRRLVIRTVWLVVGLCLGCGIALFILRIWIDSQ